MSLLFPAFKKSFSQWFQQQQTTTTTTTGIHGSEEGHCHHCFYSTITTGFLGTL
jgi:predicted phosphoadenosine phosphosulfate sulfurtransferase